MLSCQRGIFKGRKRGGTWHCLRTRRRGDFPRSFRRRTLRSATGGKRRDQKTGKGSRGRRSAPSPTSLRHMRGGVRMRRRATAIQDLMGGGLGRAGIDREPGLPAAIDGGGRDGHGCSISFAERYCKTVAANCGKLGVRQNSSRRVFIGSFATFVSRSPAIERINHFPAPLPGRDRSAQPTGGSAKLAPGLYPTPLRGKTRVKEEFCRTPGG